MCNGSFGWQPWFIPSPPDPLSRTRGEGNRSGSSPLARRRGRGVGGEGTLAVVNTMNDYIYALGSSMVNAEALVLKASQVRPVAA